MENPSGKNVKKTKILRDHQGFKLNRGKKRVVTIGNFDGIHLGHQKILAQLEEIKSSKPDLESLVISFYPHPKKVLQQIKNFDLLQSLSERQRIFSKSGLDLLFLIRFNQSFSKIQAKDFIEKYLLEKLNAKVLLIGPDTALGNKRKGDLAFLKEFLPSKGIELKVVDLIAAKEKKIGSSLIRELLAKGDVTKVQSLLSYPYCLEGRVARGEQRGRQLGFETANLLASRKLLPAHGVYRTVSKLGSLCFDSVTNIGYQPTFNGSEVIAETHLLKYNGPEFYQQKLRVYFLERLRAEKKFDNADQLKDQIEKDIALVKTSSNASDRDLIW